MISFNNVVDTFQTFVDNHFFLKTFGYGSSEDVDQEKETEFPLLHLVYTQGAYADGLKNYSLDIYILDNPLDKVDKVSFQKEVISDAEKCAEDIINDITNGFNIFTWAKGTNVVNATVTPLEEETKNVLAGVLLSVSISVPYTYNACDLPITPVVAPPPADCLPCTYTNGDGSFTVDISAGSTYTAPNITLTQADGSTSSVVPNIDLTCTFPSLQLQNTDDDVIGNVLSYPVGGVVDIIDTPVTNSDGSASENAPSGVTYTAPDITLTEVDGATTVYPSLKDLVCTWANIRVNNTVGTGLLNITSYPAGGISTLADVLVDVKNTDGTTIEANVDYTNNLEIELSDAEVEDSDGTSFDRPICSSILLPDTTINSVTVVGNLMTINTPTAAVPSGICYQNSSPAFNESFVTGDSWDNFQNGNYNRRPPTYPEAFAMLKYNATQADVRATPATGTSGTDAVAPTILEENNAFGNKLRYTDDAGNASDATVGSNIWAHVDWNNHSWTGATSYYVIDHLTGFGFTVKYEDDAGKVNLSTTGNNWAGWMTYINATHYSMTGWMPLDLGDVNNAHGARVQPNMVWADEFFEFDSSVSGSARGGFITGESYASTIFYHLYDSGNPDMVLDLTKAKDNGFQSRLTNCFMKRKHY
mgnify:CR=1 FL=1